jgi:hypothetical protein
MADEKISALSSGSPIQDTDEFVLARSGDNKKVTGANIRTYGAAPISIAIGDVATATDLIDGQLYNVTGIPVFTSGVQLNDLRFFAYKDTINIGFGTATMSPYGTANYSSLGSPRTCEITIDWYGTGNVEFVRDIPAKNEIAGFSNIDIYPFGSSDRNGNKVGSGFTLDITALTTEKFNDNTCYGNGIFTAVTGRDYEGRDFTKGYFELNFQFTFDGTPSPGDGSSIVIQKNELGVVPTIAHTGSGNFRLTSALANSLGATIDKCNLIYQHVYDGVSFVTMSADWISDNRIEIFVWDSLTGSLNDLAIANASFRIQVYF